MKKALLIGLVVGICAVSAIPAMAVDLTASGFIGIRGYVFHNARADGPPWIFGNNMITDSFNDQNGAYINSRAELQFTLRASEDLYGVFKFRMDSDIYGSDPANRYAAVGGGHVAMQVQHLYIDFRVPPKLPLWFRVGLQPVAIRPWIFYYNDAPGVSARIMIDPIKLSLTGYYVKMADPDMWSAIDGSEFYAIDAKIPLSFGSVNIAPGLFFAYQDVRSAGALFLPYGLGTLDSLNLWWIGVNFDGGVGPVKYQLDFIYNGGDVNFTAGGSSDTSSWLINGTVSYVWKKLEVGMGGRYIKGEDLDTLNTDYELFWLPGGPNFGSESLPISGDFIVWDNGWFTSGPGWPGMGLIDGPSVFWPGYWTVRAFAYYQLLDWMKLGFQVGYLGDTNDNLDVIDYWGSAGDADDDESIGWEIDFGINIQIYKNLALETGFGYLFAGKALNLAGGAPDDPWALQSRLMFYF